MIHREFIILKIKDIILNKQILNNFMKCLLNDLTK